MLSGSGTGSGGVLLLIIILVVALWKYTTRTKSTNAQPLPPGPPGLPIIGNLLDVPTTDMEAAFRDMNAKYGASVFRYSTSSSSQTLPTIQATSSTSMFVVSRWSFWAHTKAQSISWRSDRPITPTGCSLACQKCECSFDPSNSDTFILCCVAGPAGRGCSLPSATGHHGGGHDGYSMST